jgi:hypothetical protein
MSVSGASQLYHCHVTIGRFDSIGAMRSGTPAHVSVALDERIGDQVLVLATHFVDDDQIKDRFIIDENVTFARTRNRLSDALVHDFGCEIMLPADPAVAVATFETGHLVDWCD